MIKKAKQKLNWTDADLFIEEDDRIDKFESIRIKNKNTLPEIAVKRCSSGDIEEKYEP